MKISEHFEVEEFVPYSLFKSKGFESIQNLRSEMVRGAEKIRELARRNINSSAIVIINNKFRGGDYDESGLRLQTTKTGAPNSLHKKGAAIDVKIKYDNTFMTGDQMRKLVISNWHELKDFFTTIESGTDSWLHIDCRWTLLDYSKSPIIVPFYKG